MSETRWTPGPWRVGKPGEKTGTLNVVIGPDNKMTAFTGNPARDGAEIAGNAHLTAAAPDMAEALTMFLAHGVADVGDDKIAIIDTTSARVAVRKMRTALARARGE